MRKLLFLPGILLSALLPPAPALADTLPLRRGTYVEQGSSCRAPAGGALRDYNGQGIGSGRVGQCQGYVLAHIGRRYTLRQSCLPHGGADRRHATERLKLRVDSPTSFTDLVEGGRYRLCPGLRL